MPNESREIYDIIVRDLICERRSLDLLDKRERKKRERCSVLTNESNGKVVSPLQSWTEIVQSIYSPAVAKPIAKQEDWDIKHRYKKQKSTMHDVRSRVSACSLFSLIYVSCVLLFNIFNVERMTANKYNSNSIEQKANIHFSESQYTLFLHTKCHALYGNKI